MRVEEKWDGIRVSNRELSLEMTVVVNLGIEDNDLWQYNSDREEVIDSKGEPMC